MRKNYKNLVVLLLTVIMITAFAISCKIVEENTVENGKVLLSVNPEIEIEYDKNGNVTSLRGVNEDGKRVVASYSGYVGKSAEKVAEELVVLINNAGYFDDDFNGHDKNMLVKVNEGKNFNKKIAAKIAKEVNKAMAETGINSSAVLIDFDDLDENGVINVAKAKEIALNQLGLTEAQFAKTKYELDDGVYEFKFISNGIEYEYEVDAVTGKVLEADREFNDDWDDIDDDDWDDLFEVDDDDDDWDDLYDDEDDDWDDIDDDDDDDEEDDDDDDDDWDDIFDLDDDDDRDDD